MDILKAYLREVLLKEYWGEPVSAASGKDDGTKADPPGLRDEIDDPFMHKKKGVLVPKDVRHVIKKYFKTMGLTPTDKPGKTYK